MKRAYPIITILVFLLPSCFIAVETHAAEVQIDDVRVDRTSDSSFWAMEGYVRNLESHPIKAYVKIKFLNTKGHILKSLAAAVNNSKPLEPDETGLFAYRTFKMHFRGIVDFKVVFVGVEMKETKEPISQILR